MKYLGLVVCFVSLVLFMFVALVLAYSSESIGLSVMIGAMILFVCGQFLDLIEDEITNIQSDVLQEQISDTMDEMKRGEQDCPHSDFYHYLPNGCPSCDMHLEYLASIQDTESTHC